MRYQMPCKAAHSTDRAAHRKDDSHASGKKSAFPEKLDRQFDVGMNTLVHGATQRSTFQRLAMRMVAGNRCTDFNGEFPDPSHGCGNHFLANADAHSSQVDGMAFGVNSHNRRHACSERGGNEVGGRKAFALALIVHGWVGDELRAARSVGCAAAEAAFVNGVDFDEVLGHALGLIGVTTQREPQV